MAYSFAPKSDFNWEDRLVKAACNLHTFDRSLSNEEAEVQTRDASWTFHAAGLGIKDSGKTKTLQSHMVALGQRPS